ncbi:Rieske 2Fe-2S domain-containing protein [uncultured Alteromonas sp.]|jgi:nitrite reductase/ring-hydroxylating ferredoxin subunit|uniref:Rieske (2Fe-2S) protein n=1 Tax=uncultured Alteromonas sp. TaxID=179113 RepID=UPI0025DD816C|nr:Rieske 2Fe-2S domain-containing protein [uncultured Alteromonas sp.]
MPDGIMLCALDELSNGALGFDPFNDGRDTVFAVFRNGEVYAYSDVCPHYGDTSLPWKKNAYLDSRGEHIVCAAHGALFTIDEGYCVSGPCRGESLTPVPVTVKNNTVWLITSPTGENKK